MSKNTNMANIKHVLEWTTEVPWAYCAILRSLVWSFTAKFINAHALLEHAVAELDEANKFQGKLDESNQDTFEETIMQRQEIVTNMERRLEISGELMGYFQEMIPPGERKVPIGEMVLFFTDENSANRDVAFDMEDSLIKDTAEILGISVERAQARRLMLDKEFQNRMALQKRTIRNNLNSIVASVQTNINQPPMIDPTIDDQTYIAILTKIAEKIDRYMDSTESRLLQSRRRRQLREYGGELKLFEDMSNRVEDFLENEEKAIEAAGYEVDEEKDEQGLAVH